MVTEPIWRPDTSLRCWDVRSPACTLTNSIMNYIHINSSRTLRTIKLENNYLKKFHKPRRMISREATSATIVCLCSEKTVMFITVCIHASLSNTFKICRKKENRNCRCQFRHFLRTRICYLGTVFLQWLGSRQICMGWVACLSTICSSSCVERVPNPWLYPNTCWKSSRLLK